MSFNKARAKRAAEHYLTQGNIQSAIREFRLLVDHDPQDVNTQNMLGDLYVKAENKEEAVTCYQTVAEFYNKQGFAKKAIAIYNKIHRIEPDSVDVSSKLADLYRTRGSYAEARKHYEKLAAHYEGSGKLTDALAMWENIAELDPRNAEIYLKIAQSYWKDGRGSEATDAFKKAGSRHADSKNHASAVTAYSRALEISPLDGEAIEGFVRSQIDLGYPEEAIKALHAKLEADPFDRDANFLLLDCYYDMGDTASAEAVIIKMVERDPSNYRLFTGLIDVYLKEDDLDSAVRAMSMIAEHMLVGSEHEDLLALIEEVLARNPEHIAALRLLARYHSWLKDEAELKIALERVAESARINGSVEDERFALGQLTAMVPHDSAISNRLIELSGGEAKPESDSASERNKEVPSFESYAGLSNDEDTAQNGQGAPGANDESDADSLAAAERGQSGPAEGHVSDPAHDDDLLKAQVVGEYAEDGGQHVQDGLVPGYEAENQGIPSAFSETGSPEPSGSEKVKGGADSLSAADEMRLEEETESIKFYIEQSYQGLAEKALSELEQEYGPRPELAELRKMIECEPSPPAQAQEEGNPMPAAAESFVANEAPHAEPQEKADTEANPDQPAVQGAQEIAGQPEINEEVIQDPESGVAAEAVPPVGGASAGELQPDGDLSNSFENFRDELGLTDAEGDAAEDDFENHYHHAVAYQEMGLVEEAIREYQEAVNSVSPDDGTRRFLKCCIMLGHCFVEKDMPNPAVAWFKRAFEATDLSSEELKGLHYELGNAYEQKGEIDKSMAEFEEIYAVDVDYRDVSERVEKLREHQMSHS